MGELMVPPILGLRDGWLGVLTTGGDLVLALALGLIHVGVGLLEQGLDVLLAPAVEGRRADGDGGVEAVPRDAVADGARLPGDAAALNVQPSSIGTLLVRAERRFREKYR